MDTPFVTQNPTTGERVASFTLLTPAELEARLARAHATFTEWRKTTFEHRRALMLRAAALLDARKDTLADTMTLEMGKLLTAARAEVEKCAFTLRHFAENTERYLAPESIASDATRSYVRCDPLGPVLAVMPWNFALWQVVRFAAPALMAGNVGLLKHAPQVPQCALALEALFRDAGFPEGCFQNLFIGVESIPLVVDDPRVAAATLTGSERAGRSLAASTGKALKPVVLELGGSDPFIVLPSAELPKAIDVAVAARVQNNGESCIAAKRFIVHEAVWDTFKTGFVARMKALTLGDPRDNSSQLGPLISAAARSELHRQVRVTHEAGGELLCGGVEPVGPGFFYPPTVLAEPPRGTPAREEELFGPVATLLRVKSLDEAIAVANETRFGLGSCAFTNDAAEMERLSIELEAGCVFFNGMVKSDARLPFGGVKASGFGRELSQAGIREFVNLKTVWVG
ncbi:MAG: NAD-dependent succinate-semialdehyde dehydrogenase [Deltaproteobacteria bacterium]|nr:NAD-dependent succinate-semialdehyde dehydrogenase [Deltaproteobacteria bacterium]